MRTLPTIFILVLSASCARSRQATESNAQEDVLTYDGGRRAAQEEIAGGAPRIYGLDFAGVGPTFDKETGLPYVSVGGCLSTIDKMAYVRGHNDYVREWLRSQ